MNKVPALNKHAERYRGIDLKPILSIVPITADKHRVSTFGPRLTVSCFCNYFSATPTTVSFYLLYLHTILKS